MLTLFAFSLVCTGVLILRKKGSTLHKAIPYRMDATGSNLGILVCILMMASLPISKFGAFNHIDAP